MADTKTLKQNIDALEDATRQLAQDLDLAYREYLFTLVESLRRQVVSTCYGLCTQGYPGRFLRLTFDHREQVQQGIQAAIAQSCAQLADPDHLRHSLERRQRKRAEERARAAASRKATDEALDEVIGNSDADDSNPESVEDQEEHTDPTDNSERLEQAVVLKPRPPGPVGLDLGLTIRAAQGHEDESADDEPVDDERASIGSAHPNSPDVDQSESSDSTPAEPVKVGPPALIEQQDQLESALAYVVETLADDINDLLRGADIMPQELPETMLEAVIKAGSAEVVEGPPNVLSLIVQADEEDVHLAPIMAVRLQVSELEFNDTHLSAKRSQLRALHGKLQKMGQTYEKYQREWTILEAEAAWRAAWHEPS
ncbi:MAG: hypothetical protein WBA10_06195 [Elainellaceae cyanobacterium]